MVACSTVIGDESESPDSADPSEAVAAPVSYQFTVYALDQTARKAVTNGTLFQFDEGDLPFSIGSVSFGDFRLDQTYEAIYYGCSGLLMNASGENTAVTLKEASGKRIADVLYHGQDPVVVGSQVRYDSYSDMVACTGTDVIVMDWIGGNWTPRQGIIVEHSPEVTFTAAKMFVMVFEPSSPLEVAEYPIPAVALAMLLVVLLARARGTR